MQIGFLSKTPRGRILTLIAWEHLGIKAPENNEKKAVGNGSKSTGGDIQLAIDDIGAEIECQ